MMPYGTPGGDRMEETLGKREKNNVKRSVKTRRCVTAQHEQVLLKLLSDGVYRPNSADVVEFGSSSECAACRDPNDWCFYQAERWLTKEVGRMLERPDIREAVWMWAHDRYDFNFELHTYYGKSVPHGVLLVFDIPEHRLVRADFEVFRRNVVTNEPAIGDALRSVDREENLDRDLELLEEHKSYYEDLQVSQAERERRKIDSWQQVFNEYFMPDGVYDSYADGDDCSTVMGLTPELLLDELVDVIFIDENNKPLRLKSGEGIRLFGTYDGLTVLSLDETGVRDKKSGTFALSPNGMWLPRVRRDKRRGKVTRQVIVGNVKHGLDSAENSAA